MKVVILGPSVNETISGGVAVFDEGLYDGFLHLGDDVLLISANKSAKIKNICVFNKDKSPIHILFKKRKIGKIIKNFEPDLVISSLHYSLGIKTYKRMWKKACYVHILHGTPCPSNGRFKSFLINWSSRFCRKHFNKLVTVSHLSWAINQKINRVTCDSIINTGCTLEIPRESELKKDRIYDFCYVGRLYKDKNIDLLIPALQKIYQKNNKLKVCIAGYGELEYKFKKGNEYDLSFIDFVGKLEHDKVSQVFQKSKFFVSLCSLEACGLAFPEAAINGCNPIASLSSGQSPLFSKFNFYHEISNLSVDSIYNDLLMIYEKYVEIDYESILEIKNLFNYKIIAKKYKDLVETK